MAVAHDLMLLQDGTRELERGLPEWRDVVGAHLDGPRAVGADDARRAIALLQATVADLAASRWQTVERFRSQG